MRTAAPYVYSDVEIREELWAGEGGLVKGEEVLRRNGRISVGPLEMMIGQELNAREGTQITYSVIGEKRGRGQEERKVDTIQPVLPSQLTVYDDAIIPGRG